MKKNILFYFTFLCVLSFSTFAQKSKMANADKDYQNYAYIDAIKTYEKVAKKGYKSQILFEKLANAYYFNGELPTAAKWYDELFSLNTEEIKPEYYYRYAQSLRSRNEYDKADKIMEEFNALSGNDSRGIIFKKNENYLDIIKSNTGRYEVENAGVNSQYSDYGSAIYNHKLVFTTARDTGGLGQRKHSWNDQYFTNLYVADLDDSLSPGTPVKFDRNVKSKFHESTPTFTKDGNTMYFTRNNYLNGRKGKDDDKTNLLKIYKATLIEGKWSNITETNLSNDQFSVAHPCLSPDDKTLYFVSDMPGTLGRSDIYKAEVKSDGSLGKPENLGSQINTEGRETFPFITDENELYFTSDGHPGLGGMDIFVVKIKDDKYENIENLGGDINSPLDDFAFLIDTKTKRGFFSSNKTGGLGLDDIYKFKDNKKEPPIVEEIKCETKIAVTVIDMHTREILPETKLSLFDNQFNLVSEGITDSEGRFIFPSECDKNYYVRAEKFEYAVAEEKTKTGENEKISELTIPLEKELCKIAIGDDLGRCFGIKMIYFDFNKFNIHPQAAIDLEKILDAMNQYPNMKIDIRSHTDSRGSAKYNESLSDKRAKSTASWLVSNGIAAERLTSKGYGESQLVNQCADGVKCSEEEHQFNRRSEFIVTDL